MKEAFKNLGIVTGDDYIKVREGLWIACGPYEEKSWYQKKEKDTIPDMEELTKISLKLHNIITIQESCGLLSLKQISEDIYILGLVALLRTLAKLLGYALKEKRNIELLTISTIFFILFQLGGSGVSYYSY